jgi:pimeloyl-ACP methyl ester carboxylesterase
MNVNFTILTISKMLIYFLVLAVVIIAGTFILILSNSPGKPKPYKDSSGNSLVNSIAEKGIINIGDAKLGFFIKGENKNNPILLFLHGGMPEYFLTEKHPTGLDKIFTVIWLDQRGSGLSFDPKCNNKPITIDNMIVDIKEFTHYLKNRFSQDKIYLMAHSGGTYLGIKVVEKYPELYKAYIGIAQISCQKLSENKAFEYIIDQYKDNPKRKKIYEELIENPIDLISSIPVAYIKFRDYAMHDLGVGTMKNMKDLVTGMFIPSLLFKEYSLNDKVNLWRSKAGSGISTIWNEIINHDLSQESTSFKIPVYFLHGIFDYTCSYELAKEYFERIDAPDKGFYSFRHSAHSPIFEEPVECIRIIESEILTRTF